MLGLFIDVPPTGKNGSGDDHEPVIPSSGSDAVRVISSPQVVSSFALINAIGFSNHTTGVQGD
ncbi:MAG: hypothetical protein C0596_13710 [Marinilabiliales bacterium]|nr:MAG: hypothetical protein C0596_13710 [Marinilabiliales bacterium]